MAAGWFVAFGAMWGWIASYAHNRQSPVLALLALGLFIMAIGGPLAILFLNIL
jgi:hypothetical protein